MPTIRRAAGTAPRSVERVGLVALVLILSACTTAPSPSASPPPSPVVSQCGPDAVVGGGIHGTVVDPDGNPLSDIFITIETVDGFRGTTRTGSDGVFTAPGVSGDFTISTLDVNYQSLTQRVTVPCGEMLDIELVLTPTEG